MPDCVVCCDAVSRAFGRPPDVVVAVNAVTLRLGRGELVVVTGPSGCGKSTLLNLIGALDFPSSGAVTICGTRVEAGSVPPLAPLRQQHIGFLFQDAGLVPAMTALGNVTLPLRYGRPRRQRGSDGALALLDRFGLRHLASRKVEQLSGGERQRVALVRALVKRPSVLVCDEPTASLDEATSRQVAGSLRDFAADGGAVICSTHDPVMMDLASRRLPMNRGALEPAA